MKIYTIGIGTNGKAPLPPHRTPRAGIEFQPQPVVIDEATLRTIEPIVPRQVLPSHRNRVLEEVFAEIDTLEKTQMDVRHFSHTEDNYMLWAWIAFACFAIEAVLRYTVLRTIP